MCWILNYRQQLNQSELPPEMKMNEENDEPDEEVRFSIAVLIAAGSGVSETAAEGVGSTEVRATVQNRV